MGSLNHKVIVISAIIVLFIGGCTVERADQATRTTPAVPVEQEDLSPESGVRLLAEV